MSGVVGIRIQATIVILLFLASLATVVISTLQTLYLPQGVDQVQNRLREAGRRMCEASESEIDAAIGDGAAGSDDLNLKLREVSDHVLLDFPGVEGGFYLSDGVGRFAGFAFPTSERAGPATKGGSPSKNGAGEKEVARGDDPPPRETPFILVQAQHSLALQPGEFRFDVQTVGPSRVAVFTQPVGTARPARAAIWTMFRVTKPEDLANQVLRYQVSNGFALGGMALAAVLTINLIRTMQRQQLDQDKLREELRRAEHLAALGKLLAGVAHEVRNPLAGIRSTVQLWERLPETVHSPGSMQAVIHAVDRLNEIVTRLLYFSRADSAERRAVSVNQLLQETIDLVKAQAEAQRVRIETSFSDRLPEMTAAANALRQVFLNLATNALHAMPNGGVLRCDTRINLALRIMDIRFQDSGPGIASEVEKHLFEPFFTTRPNGTGLGLALCREIVLQHGGQIKLERRQGVGACFCIRLPVN